MTTRTRGKEVVSTNNVHPPIAPYSQAVRAGDYLFISGQIPLNPAGAPVGGGIAEQTSQVLQNVKSIVEAAGGSLDQIAKVNVYLADVNDYEQMNQVFSHYFPSEPPARCTSAVQAIPNGFLVLVDAIAYLG